MLNAELGREVPPMNTTRDTRNERRGELREGQRVRARYDDGSVEGTVVELRRAGGATRVVLDVDDETELDTDASRVEPAAPECPRCGASRSARHAYRCPECGADLVD
jgi:predicted RNA-binding Zn-ribbon protein involved in translation (DUF1610 family)